MYQITNLNLIPGSVLPVVNVSQYDKGRQFQLLVNEGEYAYDLTGKTVTIRGTKPDMHGFDYGTADGVLTVAGNVVNVFTAQQMTAVAGQVMAELRIASGSTILGTINFIINVEESALSDDTIISETEIPVIERDFEAALERAEDAATDAETAAGHYPYIDAVSKHWMVWDAENETWTDTGLVAEGTSGDYSQLTNKPQINSVTLTGDKSADDLGLATDDAMTGASADSAGTKGLVPAPAAGDQGKFLRGDGTWANGGGGASALDDLTDVDITSPASGDGILYDGAEWVNGAVATPTQLGAKLDVTAQQQLGAWNLAQNNGTTQTLNGATFTKNADDTVTVDIAGSAVTATTKYTLSSTTDVYVPLPDRLKPGETYYLSGCTGGNYSGTDGGSDTFFLWVNFRDANNQYLGNVLCSKAEKAFTIPANTTQYEMGINIYTAAGKLTGQVFSPMISIQPNMPYVPQVMTNRELTEVIYSTSVAGVSGLYSIKCGNVVTLILENISSTSVKSATLPTALRSRKDMSFTTIARNGTYYYLCNFAINTNGTMAIYYSPGAGQARVEVPDGWQILGSFTYVVYQ